MLNIAVALLPDLSEPSSGAVRPLADWIDARSKSGLAECEKACDPKTALLEWLR